MKVRRLFTVCSVLGLVLLAYPALACEFHEEPMGPSDECWSHDDCGQGACEVFGMWGEFHVGVGCKDEDCCPFLRREG